MGFSSTGSFSLQAPPRCVVCVGSGGAKLRLVYVGLYSLYQKRMFDGHRAGGAIDAPPKVTFLHRALKREY
jgi:hypothetical protein